jgi:GNAT superfamily N-acetyltransferase
VAVGKRLAAAQHAWICFQDEAGQTLRPPKARTWGRRGQTPVVTVTGKDSGRISIAGLLCRDPIERARVLYDNMRIFVEHAFDYGAVHFTEDRAAVAVWFRRDRPLPEIGDYERRLWLACGRYTNRFQALDTAFAQHHPDEAHHHLAFLAVHPDHQGRGIGTALLDRYHARLDRARMPTYVEASSPHSRALYARHGYIDRGTPIMLPDNGPHLWPRWRPPKPSNGR